MQPRQGCGLLLVIWIYGTTGMGLGPKGQGPLLGGACKGEAFATYKVCMSEEASGNLRQGGGLLLMSWIYGTAGEWAWVPRGRDLSWDGDASCLARLLQILRLLPSFWLQERTPSQFPLGYKRCLGIFFCFASIASRSAACDRDSLPWWFWELLHGKVGSPLPLIPFASPILVALASFSVRGLSKQPAYLGSL
ncbi:hypothetical protein L7F22_053451 [Adiantum nelumboides]|nr:hypothetical protein [Adiantum nelumboides]